MKKFLVFVDCKRDCPTKVFICAENIEIAALNAAYWWGRTVLEVIPLSKGDA